ncbi:uncharacterized protein LOC5511285 isoform X2 [Nematostella vectensis]|uniref:uncharacterized protein LOC5511285 isoform X2 n=1 Tax=Nematostella vectensis TaxID=45351 RepID=UPI0020773ADF|nr:uncharacterized protein LOC5511285 isoform X2 [Nematostella vectensis]
MQSLLVLIMLCLLGCCGAIRIEGAACNCSCDPKDGPIPPALELDPCTLSCQTLAPGGKCTTKPSFTVVNGACVSVPFCSQHCQTLEPGGSCSVEAGYVIDNNGMCYDVRFCVDKCHDFADPKDCSKYYHCDGYDDGRLRSCPTGQLWNHVNKKCDRADLVICDRDATPAPTTKSTTASTTKNSIAPTTKASTASTSTSTPTTTPTTRPPCNLHCQSLNPDGTCTVAPGYHVVSGMCQDYTFCRGKPSGYYADPKDCAQFYFCDGSAESLLSRCPRGLLWSEVKKTCDYPHLVDCSRPTTPPVTTKSTTASTTKSTSASTKKSTTASTTTSTPTTTPTTRPPCNLHCQSLNPDGTCTVAPGYHVVSGMCQDYTFCRGKPSGYYADPKDCAQFYFCYGSAESLLSRCPRGLLWSDVKKTCDYPHLVDCSRPTTPPVITKSTTASTTKSTTASTTKSTTASTTKSTTASITKGTTASTSTSTPTTTPITRPPCNLHCQTLNPDGTCTVAPGYHVVSGMCQDYTFCRGKPSGYYADPKDCAQFYFCDGSAESLLSRCPRGLLWSVVKKTCDYPHLVDCSRPTTPPVTTKSTTASTTKSTSASTTKSTTASTTTSTPTTTPTTRPPCNLHCQSLNPDGTCTVAPGYHVVSGMCQDYTFCRGKPSGYYADPKDCAQFYFCYGSAESLLSRCPRGLLWSDVKKTCDYPHLVDCSRPTTPPVITKSTTASTTKSTTASTITSTPTTTPTTRPPCNLHCQKLNPDGTCTVAPGYHVVSGMCQDYTFCRGKPSGYYADPKDCAQFYFCDGSAESLLSRCPRGLLWSEVKKTCDYPHLVDCSRPTTAPVPTTVLTTAPTTMIPTTSPACNLHCQTLQPDGTCILAPNFDIVGGVCVDRTFCRDKSVGYYPDPGDCSSNYICYPPHETLHATCPAGLLWNHITKTCDWPSNVDCDRLSSTPSTPTTAPYSGCELHCQTLNPDGSCTVVQNFAVVNAMCVDTTFCKDKPNGYYADPRDCSRFYQCDAFHRAFLHRCSPGLKWSITKTTCDWPRNVDCDRKTPTPPSPTPPTTTPKPACDLHCQTLNPDGSCTVAPGYEVVNGMCVDTTFCKDKPNGHYADPRDCSKFYQCDAFHRAFLHRCPAGLKWSVKKTACDWPRYVDCDRTTSTPPTPTTHTPTIKPACDLHCQTLNLDGTCTVMPNYQVVNGMCVDTTFCKDKPNGHYADPMDCSRFYQCDAFHRAFLHRCPAGLKWSVKKTTCDWPRYVDCDRTPTTSGTPTKPIPLCDLSCLTLYPDGTYTIAPNYKIVDGTCVKISPTSITPTTKPSSFCKLHCQTLRPDGTCTVISNYQVVNGMCVDTTFCKGKPNGHYADPRDCSRFYQCDAFHKTFLHRCPAGLKWSVKKTACDWPRYVDCDRTTSTPPTPTTKPECDLHCQTLSPDGSCTVAPGYAVVNGMCVDTYFCKEKPNGHYADPRDCTRFYQCDAFHRAFLHRCPAGLKWSVKKTACDWPRYVDCDRTTSTPPTPTPLTPTTKPACDLHCQTLNPDGSCTVAPGYEVVNGMCVDTTFCKDRPHGHYADPRDCSRFYQCDASHKTFLHRCPDGLKWSVKKTACDLPLYVDCDRTIPTVATGLPSPSPSPPTPTPKPACDLHCQTLNLDGTCTVASGYKVVNEMCVDTSFCKDKTSDYYHDPRNCSRLYQCDIFHRAFLKSCPHGLKWNIEKNACDHPVNVNCNREEYDGRNFCIGEEDGLYKHPDKCQHYIHCTGGVTDVRTCPSGLKYNERTCACDWPENVVCRVTSLFTCRETRCVV